MKRSILRALLISAIVIIIFENWNLGLSWKNFIDNSGGPVLEQKPITNEVLFTTSAQLLGLAEEETQFFIGLNIERINEGLPLLFLDPILVKAARQRSQDMAWKNYFSHEAPDG